MLNKLVRGNKYTIIGNDGFLEFNIKITLVDFIYKQYAQYGDSPYITYRKRGSDKIYHMYLNYKYTFIEGWEDINLSKKESHNIFSKIKYDDLKLENIEGFVFSGELGTTKINTNYEGLLDSSFNLCLKYGRGTIEYLENLKKVFTELNYSFNNELKEYYRDTYPQFLSYLEEISN